VQGWTTTKKTRYKRFCPVAGREKANLLSKKKNEKMPNKRRRGRGETLKLDAGPNRGKTSRITTISGEEAIEAKRTTKYLTLLR